MPWKDRDKQRVYWRNWARRRRAKFAAQGLTTRGRRRIYPASRVERLFLDRAKSDADLDAIALQDLKRKGFR